MDDGLREVEDEEEEEEEHRGEEMVSWDSDAERSWYFDARQESCQGETLMKVVPGPWRK